MTPTSETHLTVTGHSTATPVRLFALLADPTQHPTLDGSGMVRGAASEGSVTKVGDIFIMNMHYEPVGDYQVANHVVEFEPDRRIAWAVATTEGTLVGHRWIWELAASPAGGTTVTHTYDWSRVKDGGIVKREVFPLVSAAQMAETITRLGGVA